jgi:hypothetical protein
MLHYSIQYTSVSSFYMKTRFMGNIDIVPLESLLPWQQRALKKDYNLPTSVILKFASEFLYER